MSTLCHDIISQDDYTQTPPNIPEYATIISINAKKNKDHSYRTEATIACRSRSPSSEKEKRKISPLISRNLALLERSKFDYNTNVQDNRSKSPSPTLIIHNMDSSPRSPPTPPPMRNSSATTSNTGSRKISGGDNEKITHFPSNRRISRDTGFKSSSDRSLSGKLSSSSNSKVRKNCIEPGCYDVTGLPHSGFHSSTNSRGKHQTKVYTISDDQGSDESYGTGKNSPDPILKDSMQR